MKHFALFLTLLVFFGGCSKELHVGFSNMPDTGFVESSFGELPNWEHEDHKAALDSFLKSCETSKTKKLYERTCESARICENAKLFFETNFTPYKVVSEKNGLLTGYYEPLLRGSRTKKEPFVYPIYETPKDLVSVDLDEVYPELKGYRLRGRLQGDRLVPYYDRHDALSQTLESDVICYTDSKIDLFFLEVQGSGRVSLESGETLYVGYDNQNGHKYESIGKYLIQKGEIEAKDVSLQSIKAWLQENPARVDEVLNYNRSMVFFREKNAPATGAMGIELTPKRSVAVDKRYIPLGSLLYMDAKTHAGDMNAIVMAHDTGSAIKGSARADLFTGYGDEAMELAGRLKAPLSLWMLLPREFEKGSL